ncbi:MAG TPA: glycosyltransferase family 1 protein [Thermoanaerobaculia bacterium]|nr:glycosyltransferase family 1 protein [Thermoanaerobaculia bacterium]
MNLLIDARPLVGSRTGIGVHTAEIARRLAIAPPPILASHASIENRVGIEHCRFRVDESALGVVWQQLKLPRIAAEERADVVWGPHGTLPLTLRAPAVVTLHDFTSITMPGRHRLKTILSFNLFIGPSLERAARIAAVSRTTADEAMRSFGLAASRITIVPNGVDEVFRPTDSPADRGSLPEDLRDTPYLLFVGTIEPRKGIDDLLDVWESLPRPRPRLVLCGDRGWKSEPLLARARKLPDVTIAGFAGSLLLLALYQNALAFVYPSRHEGFGIPPLEAMACGAPVVATRTGAIPEFASDAALLIAPGDTNALRVAIVRILGDPALRAELGARGAERARLYRWDRSAAIMSDLLAAAAR